MTPPPETARLSPLDTERFGIPIARLDAVTPATIGPALDFCAERGVRMLIATCRVEERAGLYQAQQQGFVIMDTIIDLAQRLPGKVPEADPSVAVRAARPADESEIVVLARLAFRDYVSHYHADPRLDRTACDEVYPDWARRLAATRDTNHEVLIAESEGSVVGFHALERRGERVTQPLSAVRPGLQGKHVYQTMNSRGIEWAVARDAKSIDGTVQLVNTPIQRAVWRLGYTPVGAYFMLHKWFD